MRSGVNLVVGQDAAEVHLRCELGLGLELVLVGLGGVGALSDRLGAPLCALDGDRVALCGCEGMWDGPAVLDQAVFR